MKNFIKGIVGGIGNIVPGLSGSVLLVILNVYEDCIDAISNIFNDFKKNFLFLLPIGIGIFIGTILFSNIIKFALDNYLMITSLVFVGFVMGTVPFLFKKSCKFGFRISYLIPFILSFFLGVISLFFKSNYIVYETSNNLLYFFKLFLSGFIISFSTIIPGISSTVLLTMTGMYGIYINALKDIDIIVLLPVFLGFCLCSFFLSKLINYLLENFYGFTFFSILGWTISTIPALIMIKLSFEVDLIIGILLGFVAFSITNKCFSKVNL